MVKLRGADRLSEFITILDRLASVPDTRLLASEAYVVPRRQFVPARLVDVLETIHREYRRRLRQTDLAQAAGLSSAAFSRNFRSATGTTLVDYINDLRIGHACRLLAETPMPITDICFDSGFANLSNFNRCFRRRRRMTPSQFRSQFRG
ncbi:MAG: AraC family transcriptional regulator [Planctomycetales bacterium]